MRWIVVLGLALPLCLRAQAGARQQISFDDGWKFNYADSVDAQRPDFPDASWRNLDVPHDWSIEGTFAETNRTGGAGGFLPAGVGWYRKHFSLLPSDAQLRFFIEFDGVMANSDVWINGFHLGHRPNGYVSFSYELTGHLAFGNGKTNVLAVRADNSAQPASRWYAGAGIYRHVRLLISDPVHIEQEGTFVTTPKVSAAQATVRIETRVVNQSDAPRQLTLQSTIVAPDATRVRLPVSAPRVVGPGQSVTFEQETLLPQPLLWDLQHPKLYQLSNELRAQDKIIDDESVTFGIREVRFEPDTGFWLNGRNFKIKGVCLHHDAGGLGTAVPLRAWERRLEQLKQVGCNAIRTSHNPPAPEFLDLCDRMGFLLMDELFDCWEIGKNRYDYHLYFDEWSRKDIRDTVRRDRNHPCVVLYSAGNEIRDTGHAESAKKILAGLVDEFHQNDPTRPVTQALFRPNVSHDYEDGLADLLDVVGQNYRENELLAAHTAKPTRRIIGTENGHDRKVWLALRDNPPMAGQFLWTGFDYLGESRRWPIVAAGSGLFTRTGEARPRAFERQSWWSDRPMVYIIRRVAPTQATPADPGFAPLTRLQQEFPDWTPQNSEPHQEQVDVYSNCEEVELMLNGKSLGSQTLPTDAAPRTWKVAYEPGSLQAVGKNKGHVAATCELRTAGKPAAIVLSTDRNQLTPSWDDLAYVEAKVVDAQGVLVPAANALLRFELTGPGRVVAVDSSDNASHEPFQADSRRAYQGKSIAIIRAARDSGTIDLTASATGLTSGHLRLHAVAKRSQP